MGTSSCHVRACPRGWPQGSRRWRSRIARGGAGREPRTETGPRSLAPNLDCRSVLELQQQQRAVLLVGFADAATALRPVDEAGRRVHPLQIFEHQYRVEVVLHGDADEAVGMALGLYVGLKGGLYKWIDRASLHRQQSGRAFDVSGNLRI